MEAALCHFISLTEARAAAAIAQFVPLFVLPFCFLFPLHGCVCMYLYIHIYVNVYIFIYIFIYMYMCVLYIFIYMYMSIYCIFIYVNIYNIYILKNVHYNSTLLVRYTFSFVCIIFTEKITTSGNTFIYFCL